AHRAGVVEDHVGDVTIVHRLVTLRAQLPEHELAVEHVHLAAKRFQVKLAAHLQSQHDERANHSGARTESLPERWPLAHAAGGAGPRVLHNRFAAGASTSCSSKTDSPPMTSPPRSSSRRRNFPVAPSSSCRGNMPALVGARVALDQFL